uniref:Uncharacterized protein n=1 Tax=Anguilla anguilla TaxID=7936 RepID=A0A0E9TK44_ANGAN
MESAAIEGSPIAGIDFRWCTNCGS